MIGWSSCSRHGAWYGIMAVSLNEGRWGVNKAPAGCISLSGASASPFSSKLFRLLEAVEIGISHSTALARCCLACKNLREISPSGERTTWTSSFFGLLSPHPAHIRRGIRFWCICTYRPSRLWFLKHTLMNLYENNRGLGRDSPALLLNGSIHNVHSSFLFRF